MNVTIGIDPGKNGAMAVICEGKAYVYTFKEFGIGSTIASEVRLHRTEGREIEAMIESVHSFPGQGVASSFAFGKAFGEALGALDALNVPYRFVTPQKWQAGIPGLPRKKDGATAHKRALKIEAQRRFPKCKPTLDTCDALLIADYLYRG